MPRSFCIMGSNGVNANRPMPMAMASATKPPHESARIEWVFDMPSPAETGVISYINALNCSIVPTMHQRILILDYGSQVTQLIARRIREAGVYCEIHPGDVDPAFLESQTGLKGIILSGSHASAYQEEALKVPGRVFELGVPVLGICYGMQAMALQLGGKVEWSDHREFGYAEVRAHGHTRLLDGLQDFSTPEGHGILKVWMSHGDKVTALPPGFKLMASTPSCAIAGMADEERGFYGVQFHPEVTHTTQGEAILNRFVTEICGCTHDWNMPDYVREAVEKIREQVGDDEVI